VAFPLGKYIKEIIIFPSIGVQILKKYDLGIEKIQLNFFEYLDFEFCIYLGFSILGFEFNLILRI